jgi:hypothetical protein
MTDAFVNTAKEPPQRGNKDKHSASGIEGGMYGSKFAFVVLNVLEHVDVNDRIGLVHFLDLVRHGCEHGVVGFQT